MDRETTSTGSGGYATLAELIERAPFGIYVVDADFRIALMNAGAQEGAFRNVRPVIGRDFAEAMRVLWPEEVAADIVARFRRTLDTGEAYVSPPFTNPRHDVAAVESYEWELHRIGLPDGRQGVICYYFDSTRLRDTEARAAESEARLRLALDAAQLATFDFDLKTRTATWDAQAALIAGLPGDGGMPVLQAVELVHPKDRAHVQAAVVRALDPAGDGVFRAEYRIVREDGATVWNRTAGRVMFEGEGAARTPARLIGVNQDTTAQRLANEVVRESEETYRTLFQSIDQGFCTIEVLFDENEKPSDYRFLLVNPAFETQTGIADAVGRRIRDIAPQLEEHWFEIYGRIARTGETMRFENPAAQLNRYYDVLAWRIGAPEQRRVAILFNDISESRRVEEDLRRRTEEVRALLDAVPAYVWIGLDAECREITGNRAANEMTGVWENISQSAVATGQAPYVRQLKRDGTEYEAGELPMQQAVATGQPVHDAYIDFRLADGRRVQAIGNAVPLFDAAGRVRGSLAAFFDATLLMEAEDAARQLKRDLEQRIAERTTAAERLTAELRELAAELTHVERHERQRLARVLHDQIQQLLVASKMQVRMLATRQPGPAFEGAVHLAADLIDEALTVSRSLTTELSPSVLLEAGLGPALQWLARRFAEIHGTSVQVVFDPLSEPAVDDVRVFLFDSVRELLFNVVKHSGASRARVEVGCDEEGRVRVSVSDDGSGFDPARLFHPKGGLGLFSIKHRLEHLGGRLEIESTPGSGTRVVLVAPA